MGSAIATKHSCIMNTPPISSTIRVNLNRITLSEAKTRLQRLISSSFTISELPDFPDVLSIRGSGPHAENSSGLPEVYVDVSTAGSVCRGAHVFAGGVLGSNRVFSRDEQVRVCMDVEGRILRGWKQNADTRLVDLGVGMARLGRAEIFNRTDMVDVKGVAIEMTSPVWRHPCFYSTSIENWGYVQNLPSILATYILDPRPNDTVLDVCSAPGGKATHIAARMNDQGRVICLEKGSNRATLVQRTANAQQLCSIHVQTHYDATRCLDLSASTAAPLQPPFPPRSFDRILVDAPCSSLGQRPLLKKRDSAKQLKSYETTQRKLLCVAVSLLKPGGTLVYSTCTLRREENEVQVEYVLEKYGNEISLQPNEYSESGIVKFDPRHSCAAHPDGSCFDFDLLRTKSINCSDSDDRFVSIFSPDYATCKLDVQTDTIGFFIAKFRKCD